MGLEDIADFPSYLLLGERRAAEYLWSHGHVPVLLEHEPGVIPQRLPGSPVLYVFDYHSLKKVGAPRSVSIIASIQDVQRAAHQQDLGPAPTMISASHNRVEIVPPVGAQVHYWELRDGTCEYVRSSRFSADKRPYYSQLANIFLTDAPLAPRAPVFGRDWPVYS